MLVVVLETEVGKIYSGLFSLPGHVPSLGPSVYAFLDYFFGQKYGAIGGHSEEDQAYRLQARSPSWRSSEENHTSKNYSNIR
jgi:hypothetical protein